MTSFFIIYWNILGGAQNETIGIDDAYGDPIALYAYKLYCDPASQAI